MSVCSSQEDFKYMENEDVNSSGYGDMSFELSYDNGEDLDSGSPQSARKSNIVRNDSFRTPAPSKLSFSPPYKRVRALRLFDSPLTPKTIIQKSSSSTTPLPRSRLFGDKPKAVPSAYEVKEKPAANVNPFTPDGQLLSKKRSRSVRSLCSPKIKPPIFDVNDVDASDEEIEQPTKRVALQESNIPRYHREFLELELIGKGQFGSVFKCVNRLDGCVYAIKKSTKPVAGSAFEKTALNEVYAHAVLGKHQHVVRYYSAWAEDNHMIIQNEYCSGGSLADKIINEPLTTAELRRMLLHVAEGLRYIHSEGLVHMDLKPGNIFISIEKKVNLTNYDSADDGFEDLEDSQMYEEELTYKIGDLGHVTSLSNPQVEEGDCRYLPNEILHEDYSHLTKADVFALGLSALECAGAGPLPKNGPKWHVIREGQVPQLPQKLTKDLLELIKSMIHPDPMQRPSTLQILQHRSLNPDCSKSKADLTRELNAEKLRNEMLVKQLKEAALCIKSIQNSRLIGKKVNRSVSTTTF
ncbi:wee1-like protein kinase [Euwallacea fornicatus]|uniref:wee1-like protein kinase n=1 Tax=Euwallacea fornicatus TaxID=995702 RepID=UPI00338F530C